jgi:hypothetical protein
MSQRRGRIGNRSLGLFAVALVAAILGLATGCDDDGDAAPPTPTPTLAPSRSATATATPTDTATPNYTSSHTETPMPTETPTPERGARVPIPAVEGPVTGGTGAPFVAATTFDLAAVGYRQEEYFISGTATAYKNVGPLGEDGIWSVEPGENATYKTRILIYRPADSERFNGTVVVEWLNVSGGLDSAADWIMAHTELIREGYAWVGVSAQFVGVEGGGSIIGLPSMPLKTVDPQRYGSLVHPGDSFSYDIFSQAGKLLRSPAGSSLLGDRPLDKLIGIGESQSAFRLVTYINAVHLVAEVYDGFLVHSRGGYGTPLSESPQPVVPVSGAPRIREDVDVPVLIFQTETDITLLQWLAVRQPDSYNIRVWEVAGTAHADAYTIVLGPKDLGNSPDAARLVVTSTPLVGFECGAPINSGPHHFVLNTAIHALHRWVRGGPPPPDAPLIDVDPGPPVAIVRDAHGNARGGIRTPPVDVPTATLSGEGQEGSLFCLLFGSTAPFDVADLGALYANHDAYVSAVREAADRAVEAGFLLPVDAELMVDAAAMSGVPNAPDGIVPGSPPIAIPQ